MLVLLVMLLVALVLTISNNWFEFINNAVSSEDQSIDWGQVAGLSSAVPASCFWSRKIWYGWRWNTIFSYFLLLTNYITRMGALLGSKVCFLK